MKKIKSIILISGNGSNLSNIIKNVNSGYIDMEISMVISNNPDAKGLIIASENKLPTLVLDTSKGFDNKLSEIIEKNSIGLVVLAGFMKIISKNICHVNKKSQNKIFSI